jgi:penicillin-binding protein 1A
MGRDDARAVPGLQGGTAPARAFAQYMRFAVAKRPVEQFETAAKMPEWMLEPDDEAMMSGNAQDYYYVDDQGNLVDPGNRAPGPAPEAQGPDDGRPEQVPGPPPAAGDDFLDRATGREQPQPARRPGAVPAPGNRREPVTIPIQPSPAATR